MSQSRAGARPGISHSAQGRPSGQHLVLSPSGAALEAADKEHFASNSPLVTPPRRSPSPDNEGSQLHPLLLQKLSSATASSTPGPSGQRKSATAPTAFLPGVLPVGGFTPSATANPEYDTESLLTPKAGDGEPADVSEFEEGQGLGKAVFLVMFLSVVIGAISVFQEEYGRGVEAHSHRKEGSPPINTVNTLWLLVSTALVMIMTPAVSLYYGGMVADDNVLNRMVRTFVNLGLVGFQFTLVGYSLAFAPSNPYMWNLIGDFSFAAMGGVGSSPAGCAAESFGIPHSVFVMYQLMFASITTTILSGSIANLMSFHSFCLFILMWTTLVYDPLCHAIWGGGLMSWHLDFAGGLVIHVSSGASAAAAATYLYRLWGKTEAAAAAEERAAAAARRERREEVKRLYNEVRDNGRWDLLPDLNAARQMEHDDETGVHRRKGRGWDVRGKRKSADDGEPEDQAPGMFELLSCIFDPTYTKEKEMVWDRALGGVTIAHNRTFVVLGAVLLWFGWFGFNGGSALAPNDVAGAALLNTNIAASMAMLTWMFCESLGGGNPSAIGAATGAISGLVGITPCAGYITTLASVPVGMMSAAAAFSFVWIEHKKGWLNWFSNPLDVMASHGVSGLMGTVLTGVYAFKPVAPELMSQSGVIYSGEWTVLKNACLASIITVLFSIGMTLVICVLLTKMLGVDGLLSAGLLRQGTFGEGIDTHYHEVAEDEIDEHDEPAAPVAPHSAPAAPRTTVTRTTVTKPQAGALYQGTHRGSTYMHTSRVAPTVKPLPGSMDGGNSFRVAGKSEGLRKAREKRRRLSIGN